MATQSHTMIDNTATGTDASNAVDRNTATCMKSHTKGINSPEKTVWWKVNLGGVLAFKALTCCLKTTTATVCSFTSKACNYVGLKKHSQLLS